MKRRLYNIRKPDFIFDVSVYIYVSLYLEANKSVEQQGSSIGDEIMGISIRDLCWQAHKPIPVILCKHCLFKKTEKID